MKIFPILFEPYTREPYTRTPQLYSTNLASNLYIRTFLYSLPLHPNPTFRPTLKSPPLTNTGFTSPPLYQRNLSLTLMRNSTLTYTLISGPLLYASISIALTHKPWPPCISRLTFFLRCCPASLSTSQTRCHRDWESMGGSRWRRKMGRKVVSRGHERGRVERQRVDFVLFFHSTGSNSRTKKKKCL